ncbi:MAG: hypothetical protein IJY27_00910 [Clostridia bacterium]|nr:hypothetical protein [Clostridia bacterium]
MIYLDTPTRLGTLNRAAHTVINQGSKGANVAIMLKTLGADPHYFTFTGGELGALSESFTDRAGVRSHFTKTECGVRMNVKVIDIDGVCTELNECGGPVTSGELDAIISALKNDESELVVMNGSLPQGVPTDVYECIIKHFSGTDTVTVLDCDGEAMKKGLRAHPTLIKPNRRELAGIVGACESELCGIYSVLNAAKSVKADYGCDVICTLDGDGSIYVGEHESYIVSAAPVVLQGFSGAGDTYLSAYIYKKYIQKCDTKTALAYASAAAGAKVALPGTTLPSVEQIQALVGSVEVREITH